MQSDYSDLCTLPIGKRIGNCASDLQGALRAVTMKPDAVRKLIYFKQARQMDEKDLVCNSPASHEKAMLIECLQVEGNGGCPSHKHAPTGLGICDLEAYQSALMRTIVPLRHTDAAQRQ